MSAPIVFVIKNQAGLFLNKQMEWIEGPEGQTLYRTAHRDEAVNTVFEVSAKDIYLRAEAVACPVDAKGQPAVQAADLLAAAAPAIDEPAAQDENAEPILGTAAKDADDVVHGEAVDTEAAPDDSLS